MDGSSQTPISSDDTPVILVTDISVASFVDIFYLIFLYFLTYKDVILEHYAIE